jgi:hypothetical protein
MDKVLSLLVVFLFCGVASESQSFCKVCECFGAIVKCESADLREIPKLAVGQRPTLINFKSNPNLKCSDIEHFKLTTGISIWDDCEIGLTTTETMETTIPVGSASVSFMTLTILTTSFGLFALISAIVGAYFMYKHHVLLRNIASDIRVIRREHVELQVRPALFHDIADETRVKEIAGSSGTSKPAGSSGTSKPGVSRVPRERPPPPPKRSSVSHKQSSAEPEDEEDRKSVV